MAYLVGFVLCGVLIGLQGFRAKAGRSEILSAAEIAPKTGRFVHAGDVDLFVQEAGPADGPAVLFVHGTGAWSETWRDTLTALAGAGFHAIALDLPPFGFSQRPSNGLYDKRSQGKRILGLLDGMSLDRVALVGHSFGGGPTVEAALLNPQRIQALILVDVALGLNQQADGNRVVKGVLGVAPLRDALVAAFLTNAWFTKRLLGAFVADPNAITDQRVRIYQQPLAVNGTTEATGVWLPELVAPPAGAASSNPASYPALTMPSLVLWGGKDTITPLEQGQSLAKILPNAKLVVMDTVGHIPQIEDNERFNEQLLLFLVKQKGARQ